MNWGKWGCRSSRRGESALTACQGFAKTRDCEPGPGLLMPVLRSDSGKNAMEGSYPRPMRLWETTTMALLHHVPAPATGRVLAGPHHPREFAERLYACEALNPLPAGTPPEEGPEPYSLQWFLNIENRRHSKHGRWIPRLLEFAKHSNETLLGLGNGLGTDWLQYARHGAEVVVCSPSPEQLALIRRNFELRGLRRPVSARGSRSPTAGERFASTWPA